MGQIEELERELESIKYQVGQIQLGLSRATHAVVDIKEEQKKLQQMQAQIQSNMQQANMQQPQAQMQSPMQSQPQMQPNMQQSQLQPNMQQPQMNMQQPNMQQPQMRGTLQPQGMQSQYRQMPQGAAPAQPMNGQQNSDQTGYQSMQNRQQFNPAYHQSRQQFNPAYQQNRQQFNAAYQQNLQQLNPAYQQNPQSAFRNINNANKNSAESWIGKHLMGVFASVLIFIALILFASLIIPYLNDVIKIGLMFTVSIALTGFAFYEHKKRPGNTFFTALLACGLGCSYLSILVTRIYFKVIGDVAMYVLLLGWAGIILYMGKKESKLFQVIGNAGYIISALLAWNLKDGALVLPVLVYLLIMGGAFQYNFRKDNLQRTIQSCINQAIILYFATRIGHNVEKCVSLTVSAGLIVVISAAYFAAFLFGKKLINSANKTFFASASAIVFYVSFLLLADCLKMPKWIALMVFFGVAAIAEAEAFLQRNKKENETVSFYKSFWITAWFAIAEIGTYVLYQEFFDSGALFVALIPIAVYGVKKEYALFRNQAIILAALMTLLENFGEWSIIFCAVELVYAIIVLVMEGFVVKKSFEYKFIWYFYVQACIALLFWTVADKSAFGDDGFRIMCAVIPVGIFNMLMRMLKFDRDDKGVSNITALMVLDGVNAAGLLLGLYNIYMVEGAALQGINIAFTTALACVNVRRHFAGKSAEKLYAGIKFGIILLVSLISYDAAGYIVSVAVLAFAILCIVIGFNKIFGAKELRIYGLVLAMVSVVKFIMYDITYENTIGRAISFLISGILCFGISAIYNHFEKQGQQ
ncbi:MAG: hypothetical protein VZR24_05335 [Butyrivibrio hungatei]|nr:hypothetical protein [Butyrivibrio hungatei]